MKTNLNTALEVLTQDLWVHVAALAAVAIGFTAWSQSGLTHDPSPVELMFMIGGLAALGVRIVNGSVVVASAQAALVTKAVTDAIRGAAAGQLVAPKPVDPA